MLSPPPELVDDLIAEILLRFPPDNPARLVRLSLVCKPWRRLLSDPAFLPRFRAYHRPPPILGFLCNVFDQRGVVRATFVSTSAFSPLHRNLSGWRVLYSRHGLVLFHTMESGEEGLMELVVWDPVTDEEWGFPMPGGMHCNQNAAVLCAAADGCDHLDCHGGPFLVVFLCTDDDGLTSAFVYSSESGEWSDPTPAEQVLLDDNAATKPTLLVGNTLYFLSEFGSRVMQYDLGKRELSVIDLPPLHEGCRVALMTAEDGGVGFAGVLGSSVHLWSKEAGLGGAVAWARRRVIELGTLLPAGALRNSEMLAAIGFAEGVGACHLRQDKCWCLQN